MNDITQQQLSDLLTKPDRETCAENWIAPLNTAMRATGISTPRRQAAFLAQLLFESSEFRTLEESLSFSEQRLQHIWPKHFPDLAAASAFSHTPEKLANKIYACRTGNGDEASGDGWKYRDRGLIKIRGRASYALFSKAMHIDALDHPDLLLKPAGAALAAAWFWKMHGLNELSDLLDGPQADEHFIQLCRRVAGDTTGVPQRVAYWRCARQVLGAGA